MKIDWTKKELVDILAEVLMRGAYGIATNPHWTSHEQLIAHIKSQQTYLENGVLENRIDMQNQLFDKDYLKGLQDKIQSLEAANKALQDENVELKKVPNDLYGALITVGNLREKLAIAEKALEYYTQDETRLVHDIWDKEKSLRQQIIHLFDSVTAKEALQKIREGK